MITVTFYYRPDDAACLLVEKALEELQPEIEFQWVRLNIHSDPALEKVVGGSIPMVIIGPYTLKEDITKEHLRIAMLAAQDRKKHLERTEDRRYDERMRRGSNYGRLDRFSDWVSHHYLALFNMALFFYIAFAFLPSVLMKANFPVPAKILYTLYSPLCHQLAFRSWFLFGEQAYYPRSLAGIGEVASYETAVLDGQPGDETSADFIGNARLFLGNDQIGYKVALCQRDVALYGGMLFFGMLYVFSGRKIRQTPWYIWLIFGLVPIGVDGFSQFPGLIANLPSWLPVRESTPFLRTLTGLLFGGLTAGYLYPLIEETMQETRAFLASKKLILSQTKPD